MQLLETHILIRYQTMELNGDLELEQRVKGKIPTMNLVSVGDEDILTPEMNDFNFGRRQLERLQQEVMLLEKCVQMMFDFGGFNLIVHLQKNLRTILNWFCFW